MLLGLSHWFVSICLLTYCLTAALDKNVRVAIPSERCESTVFRVCELSLIDLGSYNSIMRA